MNKKKAKDAAANERKFYQEMYSQDKKRAAQQWLEVLKEIAEDAKEEEKE